MTKNTDLPRVETGVRNLDAIYNGGLPRGSVTVVSGPPGSGKTILTQQICFHNASARAACSTSARSPSRPPRPSAT